MNQERCDPGVVELREGDDRRSAQAAGLGEFEDAGKRFQVADLGEVGEDAGALRHGCLGVEQGGAQLIQRGGVAEGHGDLAGAAADLIRGVLSEFGVNLRPCGWFFEAYLSDETILDTVKEGGAELVIRDEQGLAQDFELFAFSTRFDRRGG